MLHRDQRCIKCGERRIEPEPKCQHQRPIGQCPHCVSEPKRGIEPISFPTIYFEGGLKTKDWEALYDKLNTLITEVNTLKEGR